MGNKCFELFLIDAKSGVSNQITFTNKEFLSGFKLAEVKKRMVPSTDGKEILTWVIYPPDFDPTKKYPTLLYCQGGPEQEADKNAETETHEEESGKFKWYAVRIISGHENKVKAYLDNRRCL